MAGLLMVSPAFADCPDPNFQTCGTLPPIATSAVVPVEPPPLDVCVFGACGSPDHVIQDHDARAAAAVIEQEAIAEIAELRGIANDQVNLYWSRGEIRANMYLRLLQIAKATSPSTEEQDVAEYYAEAIGEERIAVAHRALELYAAWQGDPCSFDVPVGDPAQYRDERETKSACDLPPNSQLCLYGDCIPPPPSAERFLAWAALDVLQDDVDTWGASLTAGTYTGLTQSEAADAVALEYQASFGGLAEGVAFLTSKKAALGTLPQVSYARAESTLSEQWAEGLHDAAGERLFDFGKDVLAAVFKAQIGGDAEATLAQVFGVETAFSAYEAEVEVAGIELAEASWDTFIGPAVAALLVVAVETWHAVEIAEVPERLQRTLDDAEQAQSLSDYAESEEGRQLILEALVKSTMPDFLVVRSIRSKPAGPGPIAATDPTFSVEHMNWLGSTGTDVAPAFEYTDWEGTVSRVSVANGWLVQSKAGSTDPPLYVPNVSYVIPHDLTSTGVTTGVNPEHWRAWLDHGKFLAQRESVRVGLGYVTRAYNSCPSILVANPSFPVATAIDLGTVCVQLQNDKDLRFKKGDQIVIEGQTRIAAGDEVIASDGKYYVQTTEAFGDDLELREYPVPISMVVHPNENCLTSSVLGDLIQGPDCTYGPSISPDHSVVTIVPPSAHISFQLSDLPSIEFGAPPFSVAGSFHSSSAGSVTFSAAAESVGCSVSAEGIVTITGANPDGTSCVINASQAASEPFAASPRNLAAFHIYTAIPTVSISAGTFVFNGSQQLATGFAYGIGGPSDIQSPSLSLSYLGIDSTSYGPSSAAPSHAGTYAAIGSFAGNVNYSRAIDIATLTIDRAQATIAFDAGVLSQVYDGRIKTVSTTTAPPGLSPVNISFIGTPVNAGSYPVTATLNHPDYQGSASGILVIAKAPPNVTFTGAPPSAAKGTSFTVSATTNSTASAIITAVGACSVSGNTVTMDSNSGVCQLTADWPSDENYLAASATQSTLTPGAQIASLTTLINQFQLSPLGIAVSFTSQLQSATAHLDQPGHSAACNDLAAFINHAQAQQSKKLSIAQAAQMIAGADQVIGTLGCSSNP
ncbi:MAG TPA: MBG domain-containing protein [Polyangiaceae bacterium]|nr:MBG domain-containing protein [Polyangiaceae bacterium]